jgi:beta-phosphoglucomutase-like phosphatase (HAD superfamily)
MPGLRAVLFDLDGVLTPTVALHLRAWEHVVLRHRAMERVP